MAGNWTGLGAAAVSFFYLYDKFKDCIPFQLRDHLATFFHKVVSFANPYDQIIIHEYRGEYMHRDELYAASQAYLSSVCSFRAHKLKAELGQESGKPSVTIDDYEEVIDTFRGVRVWWCACMRFPYSQTISFYPKEEERKYYRLIFHKRNRKLVEGEYLNHILREGRHVTVRRRQRKLFTNSPSGNLYSWSHVAFEHPATFDTLAIDPKKKGEIIDDLVTFREGKDYYKKIGKVWKRGYLLYGPPGTGKSSMIAAIANFLGYCSIGVVSSHSFFRFSTARETSSICNLRTTNWKELIKGVTSKRPKGGDGLGPYLRRWKPELPGPSSARKARFLLNY